jgi:hypothetical protein
MGKKAKGSIVRVKPVRPGKEHSVKDYLKTLITSPLPLSCLGHFPVLGEKNCPSVPEGVPEMLRPPDIGT